MNLDGVVETVGDIVRPIDVEADGVTEGASWQIHPLNAESGTSQIEMVHAIDD